MAKPTLTANSENPQKLLFSSTAYFSSAFMSPFLTQLSNEFHIFSLDFRGHGHSTCNKPLNEVDDLVEDVKQFVDALGLKKFYLVGWSLGGATAMKFAAKYPAYVEKLVLHASVGAQGVPCYKLNEQGVETTERLKTEEEVIRDSKFGRLMSQTKATQDREKIAYLLEVLLFNGRKKPASEAIEKYVDEFFLCRCQERTLIALNMYNISNESNGVTDRTNEILKIKSKVLILHGEKDSIIPCQDAEDLKKRFQDQAEFKLYAEGGHALLVDYPEEVISAIRDFCS